MRSKAKREITSSRLIIDEISAIEVSRHSLKKDTPLHFHDYYEIEMVVSGEGRQMLNGSEFPLRRGCITFLSPVDFHQLYVGSSEIRVLNVSFAASFISKYFSESLLSTGTTLVELDEDEIQKLETVFEFMLDERDLDDRHSKDLMPLLMQYLVALFERSRERHQTPATKKDSAPISIAMQYIFEHYLESPSFEEVAIISGYAPTYFSKLFHDVTGQRYSDFLATMKINHAKMLLITTNMNTIDIAYACGFKSSQTFYRVFKKITGTYPGEFRKSFAK